mmetsp:Transcript_9742/g.21041  ORF Transcript_9742/g.21041 Transcript_9742/m.21041 type:complete len:1023 (-) Transcript_9742:106-3174(-)
MIKSQKHVLLRIKGHPRHQHRIQKCDFGGNNILLLATLITALIATPAASSSTNFCGSTWGDASSDCEHKQPCPNGTDEECTNGGVCWADTTCDSNNGAGLLYNKNDPSHLRFCGSSWTDASENCNIDRHCPSGESTECPDGLECYHFLGSCNFVEMLENAGGIGAAISSSSSSSSGKLPSTDPSRSNWCGSDWNDAVSSCHILDHWCQSGSDGDCPPGKICFAGTDCKYEADLVPTEVPTKAPSGTPTASPVVYGKIENTRFCGNDWMDASENCQISTHCPSGMSNECDAGQSCFGGINGCNIIDMIQHKKEFGTEIYGSEQLVVDVVDDEEEGAHAVDDVEESESTGDEGINNSISTPSPTISPTSSPTLIPGTKAPVITPEPYNAINHIFCGKSFADAEARCSPETFCANGPLHTCKDEGDSCWSGISACDASDWVPTKTPTILPTVSASMPPTKSPESIFFTLAPIVVSTPIMTSSPDTANLSKQPSSIPQVMSSSTMPTSSTKDINRYTAIQSYCARDYIQLMNECLTIATCDNQGQCPYGYNCFVDVSCPYQEDDNTEIVYEIDTDENIIVPVTSSPITSAPVIPAPVVLTMPPNTPYPTQSPSEITLSVEELAKRLSKPNNYCGKSKEQIVSSCHYTLQTCNEEDRIICPIGTYCFSAIVCEDLATADGIPTVTNSPVSAIQSPTPQPTTPPTSPPTSPSTSLPTLQPTKILFTNSPSLPPSHEGIATKFDDNFIRDNYCAQNNAMLQLTCAMAPLCEDDNSCPLGTFCFKDVVCQDLQSEHETMSTASPTNNALEQIAVVGAEDCNNLCLSPIGPHDCNYALNIGLQNLMPCSSAPNPDGSLLEIGDVCIGTGYCGTDLDLNNCAGSQDLYVRLDYSMCEDALLQVQSIEGSPGTNGSISVQINVANSTTTTVDDSKEFTKTSGESAGKQVAREGSNKTLPAIESSNLSWKESSKSDSSFDNSYSDYSKTNDNGTYTSGWWVMERSRGYSKRNLNSSNELLLHLFTTSITLHLLC